MHLHLILAPPPATHAAWSLQEEITGEDTTTNMRFLRIDCGSLKQTVVGHCEQWVQKFTSLLNQLAHAEIKSIHDYFKCDRGHGGKGGFRDL